MNESDEEGCLRYVAGSLSHFGLAIGCLKTDLKQAYDSYCRRHKNRRDKMDSIAPKYKRFQSKANKVLRKIHNYRGGSPGLDSLLEEGYDLLLLFCE